MNKEEFLSQLETHLSGMPENEKQEALQYYRDYFEDAGKEKEKEILESLGSPAEVAENIRVENQNGEWTERGYRAEQPSTDTCIVQSDAASDHNNTEEQKKDGNIEVESTWDTDLNTYINEDSDGSEHKVAESPW